MPGTVQTDATTTESNRTETDVPTMTPVSTTEESTIKISIGGVLFYTVIGVGGAIITLIFSFMIVCVLIGLSVQKKRKSHTLTIAATLQAHNDIHTQGMVCYINHTDIHTHIYIVYITLLPFCGCAFDIVIL